MLEAGVTHLDPDQEAVELRLGEPVNAFLLDRVLRRHHHERERERHRRAVHRDLILLHRFEQGRLRLGGGAVDFVGEKYLGEDRPLAENEVVRVAVEDRGAGHVGGEQVRRELHALVLAAEQAGEHFRERRLRDAGDAFEQDVPAGE